MENLKSFTRTFFEVKATVERLADDGTDVMKKEVYSVDALTCTEAESRLISELTPYVTGELQVDGINRAPYKEVVLSDSGEIWFKAEVKFLTTDERTGKVKKTKFTYLVRASSLDDARLHIDSFLKHSFIEWEWHSLSVTKVLDVFLHNSNESVE